MNHVISCRDSVFGNREDAFRLLPEAGIHHAELSRIEPQHLPAAKSLAAQHGLEISTVGAGLMLSDRKSIDAYDRLMAATAEAGIGRIFTSIGASGDEDRGVCIGLLKEVAARAAGLGTLL